MSLKGGSSDQKSFQLAYRSLEGYANLLGRKVEVHTWLYHCNCMDTRGHQLNVSLCKRSALHFGTNFRLLQKRTSVHLAEYKFRTCIFNIACKRFEGRFYDSMPCRLVESLQTGAVMCPIEQVFFWNGAKSFRWSLHLLAHLLRRCRVYYWFSQC